MRKIYRLENLKLKISLISIYRIIRKIYRLDHLKFKIGLISIYRIIV